jgi:ABC-2 type transport system ATP-binding protein
MIKVEGLTKRYARTVAVDHISFEVLKGQIVGFLGPNGAGKTTTMRMLTCFMPPSEGTAEVAGFDVLKSPMEVKKRIGYLPETPPVYPDMEVREYLDFVGRLKGVPKSEIAQRVKEVSERCAIADVSMKLIGKLSKGYRQRVGLAQAIIHNPDVLILDEPTSGLDPKQIIEARELIKGLAGDHTIILSTHILSEVEATCEQAIIIAKGKVAATGSVQELKHRQERGGALIHVEIEGRGSELNVGDAEKKLTDISGVARVVLKHKDGNAATYEIESPSGAAIRGDIARAIVAGGWNLNELRSLGMSLEDVFLELTGSQKKPDPAAAVADVDDAAAEEKTKDEEKEGKQ